MSTATLMSSFDRIGLLDEIKAGYYRTAMSGHRDPKALEREQDDRAREEARFAREAQQPADQRAHDRRADKAAYLRDKLAEAEQAEREKDES